MVTGGLPILLLSARQTPDSQRLWRTAVAMGWDTERIRGVDVPPWLCESRREKVLYMEELMALEVAERLSVTLTLPAPDWLAHVPRRFALRSIRYTKFADLSDTVWPLFVKPPNQKSFPAKVYESFEALPDYVDHDEPVLTSDPVAFEVEYRCFCLDGEVTTLSPYMRAGKVLHEPFETPDSEGAEARAFATAVLTAPDATVPDAIVLDVGRLRSREWAVIEVNAAWGSGVYGCEPREVLTVIRRSCKPSS